MYYVIDNYEEEGFYFLDKVSFRRWLLNEYDEDRYTIQTSEQEHLEKLAKYYVDNDLDDLYDGINKRGGIYDVNY